MGCAGEYPGIPSAEMLDYQNHHTYGSLHRLATAYGKAINAAIKADTLHPGMYADYGVTLALMGHQGPACRMLNAEMNAFPESRPMVTRLKKQLIPEMMGDTLCGLRDTVNLDQLASWAYDSLTSLMTLPNVVSVIDSSDTAWLHRQTPTDSTERILRLTATQKRELLEQEVLEAERQKKARIDSIAAAKEAKIIAREKAKKEQATAREEAKAKQAADREQERARKAAEREEAKAKQAEERAKKASEREEAKAKQAAEREQERARKAAEREEAKAQQAAEREQERAKKAAEREEAKARQAAEREQERAMNAAEREKAKSAKATEEEGGEEQ